MTGELQAPTMEGARDVTEALSSFGLDLACPDFIDQVEAKMMLLPSVECEFDHTFTPGLYTKTIEMLAGTLVVSKIHKTTHPFVIHSGVISVWTKETGVVLLVAPHIGITTPGTRRLLFAHEDTVWSTFHPTNSTDFDEIEEELITPYVNPIVKQMIEDGMLTHHDNENIQKMIETYKPKEPCLN